MNNLRRAMEEFIEASNKLHEAAGRVRSAMGQIQQREPTAWRWKVSVNQKNWCYGEQRTQNPDAVMIEPLFTDRSDAQ